MRGDGNPAAPLGGGRRRRRGAGEATYNARKGKGYEVQIAETCVETDDDKADTVNMITHVAVTDACASDEHATMPVLEALQEGGQRPDELVADTAFGSGENALNAERLGTELISPVKGPQMDVDQRPDTVSEADFLVDARLEDPAICPAGYLAREQRPCEGEDAPCNPDLRACRL